jgi:hypothetical protein
MGGEIFGERFWSTTASFFGAVYLEKRKKKKAAKSLFATPHGACAKQAEAHVSDTQGLGARRDLSEKKQ